MTILCLKFNILWLWNHRLTYIFKTETQTKHNCTKTCHNFESWVLSFLSAILGLFCVCIKIKINLILKSISKFKFRQNKLQTYKKYIPHILNYYQPFYRPSPLPYLIWYPKVIIFKKSSQFREEFIAIISEKHNPLSWWRNNC